jgi:pimeloyl-ACP methyl ester carboxylesterase
MIIDMKTFVTNRDGNKIVTVVEGPKVKGKLAFVMHGLSGNKERITVRSVAEAFLENGYTVVTWDAVHTFGESTGGKFEDATITNYYVDLEDVIQWASTQDWYSEPFVLAGHSLGGIGTAMFAEKYPEKVSALAPLSTIISGKLSLQTREADFEKWKRDGIKTEISHDGKRTKILKWSHMEDRLKYDLLEDVERLTMPVLMIVGDRDISAPPEHQRILFDKLPGRKEIHIIKGAEHSFYEPSEQIELKQIVKNWIATI